MSWRYIAMFLWGFLRGLAARAPYFHNRSAATLLDAVNFYDKRFNIGFTNQQKEDLVNFLKTPVSRGQSTAISGVNNVIDQ
jgi:cytochrome c peroxidase